MSLIKTIRETRGTLNKMALLKSANELDKKIFKYAYDKSITFGITFDDVYWNTVRDDTSDELFILLDKLASRELSGNTARLRVYHHALAHGDLIKLICNKDLDCGIAATTLEAVFGKTLVNKFSVQLAKEVPVEALQYPMMAQIKYDGVRVITIIENNKITFKTRNGKTFSCPTIENQLKGLKNGNYILDGEFVADSGLSSGRTSISGRVNSAIHGGTLAGSDILYFVFDAMPLKDFNAGKCNLVHYERTELIPSFLGCPNVKEAQINWVFSAEEANKLYNEVLSQGYEGLILKTPEHKYSFKRSKDWIKVKAIQSTELLCSDIEEGSGKYELMIGALKCYGLVDGKNVMVSVGSGLSDSDRNLPNSAYLGKKIEVKYNSVIKDSKTGQWSLFLPRFIAVREDI